MLLATPANAEESAKIKTVAAVGMLKAAGHKLTILHLWATWCVPCVAELPELDAFAKAHPDLGVIALSEDTSLEKVRNFFAVHKITALTPALDEKMTMFQKAQGIGLPTTLFIDANGRMFARADGPLDWKSKDVSDFIEQHLK